MLHWRPSVICCKRVWGFIDVGMHMVATLDHVIKW
jgi:hypothetical protein